MGVRPIYITGPLAVALGIASAILFINARPTSNVSGLEAMSRHAVTDPMRKDADARARDVAPRFEKTDAADKPVVIGGKHDKPQFVYFIKEGCPCSFDAEPILNSLYKHLGKKVDFVAIINQDQEGAKKWSGAMLPPYPVVADPKLEMITAFKIKSSVYGVLLDNEGRIVKMWPGYSKNILSEMNKVMSAEAGVEVKPFDSLYAPKPDTAGCDFVE